jgi:hypothetical protein
MSFISNSLALIASIFACTDYKCTPNNLWADVKCPKELL